MILTLVCNYAPGALLLLAWLFFSLVEHSIHKCSIFYSMLYSRYLFEHIIMGREPIDLNPLILTDLTVFPPSYIYLF